MSNARKLADNLPTEGSLSERNLVINGNMTIAQRSSSVSSQTGSGYKTVDRIYTNASGATYNQSQQTVTVGGETGLPLQFTKYLRHNVTTGNNWSQIYHKIEDVTSVPVGTATLSFYAKGTSPNAGLTFYAWQNFGSGGSSEVGISSISQTVTLTSTWQRFTVPITIPSITGKTIGTGSHFYFGIGQGGSTSTNAWTLDITGLMLEVGSQASPFEHEPVGVTLSKAQRYYIKHVIDSINGQIVMGQDRGTAGYYGQLNWMQEMRSAPTVTGTGIDRVHKPGVVYDTIATGPNFYQSSVNGMYVLAVTTSTHANSSTAFLGASSGGSINIDAEL